MRLRRPSLVIATAAMLTASMSTASMFTGPIATAAASTFAGGVPEQAATVPDPVGDVSDPRADAVSASVDAPTTGTITVSITVQQYTDPLADVSWRDDESGPLWLFDTDLDDTAEYVLLLYNVSDQLVAFVLDDATGDIRCDAEPSATAATRTYRATFPATCIGNPERFGWSAEMYYAPDDGATLLADSVPDTGWAGPLGNDAAQGTDAPLTTVDPARLLDTRPGERTVDERFAGIGRRPADSVLALEVRGRGGVAGDASAVVLNVTAVLPDGPGFVTVYPCDAARPTASNVNYGPGQVVPNAVLAKVAADGTVCLYTSAAADLIVDVNGFVPAGGSPVTVVPARLLDSRPGERTVDRASEGIGRRPAGSVTVLPVAGRGGVGLAASAVLVNVTAVFPDGPGFLTVFPCGSPQPRASSVNYSAGQVVPNAVLAKVGTDGEVCIFTSSATDLIVDVSGYVPATGTPATVVPARLLDTRPGEPTVDQQFQGIGRLAGGSTTAITVVGRGGVSASASSVMLNVTAVAPSGPGFVTVFPCGSPLPTASNVNYSAGQVVPNAVLAKVGAGGAVCVFTPTDTDLIIDVNGFVD
jgi:hypothetical protein